MENSKVIKGKQYRRRNTACRQTCVVREHVNGFMGHLRGLPNHTGVVFTFVGIDNVSYVMSTRDFLQEFEPDVVGPIEFDCVDAGPIIDDLNSFLDVTHDSDAKVEVQFFGLGGMNPCLTLTGLSPDTAERVRYYLRNHGMAWGENGQTFDYAYGPDGMPPRKCSSCWEPVFDDVSICAKHRAAKGD